jgi:hypothetical protein
VRPEFFGLRERVLAALREAHLVAFAAQQDAEQQHRIATVVRDQHANRAVLVGCCHAPRLVQASAWCHDFARGE